MKTLGTLKGLVDDLNKAILNGVNSKRSRSAKTPKRQRGDAAESIAAEYLKQKGLQLIDTNFHCRHGEIDLILIDTRKKEHWLVFVEVRFRKQLSFGGGLESITVAKQIRLRKTANTYLQKNKLTNVPSRMDVVVLTGELNKPKIDWIENAF